MMTQLEERFYTLACSFFSKFIHKDIDWEERRYEIAKDIYATSGMDANLAVERADKLIEELKKKK